MNMIDYYYTRTIRRIHALFACRGKGASRLIKIAAVITLCAFLFTGIIPADCAAEITRVTAGETHFSGGLNINTFFLPRELGDVAERDAARNSSDQVVIHIQDAHCDYNAQRKISDIIAYLNREYGIDAVNLEGGSGGYDLSVFENIGEAEARDQAADQFVQKGLMNGAEHFAVNNPGKVTLWGAEDAGLYRKNLIAFREFFEYREEADKCLNELERALMSLKERIYSKDLSELDANSSAHDRQEISFKDYAAYLVENALRKKIDIVVFDNMRLFSRSLDLEKNIDFKKADRERALVVDALSGVLSKAEFEELAGLIVRFSRGAISQKDFYDFLARKSAELKIDMAAFPEFRKYTEYIILCDDVDWIKAAEEAKDLEIALKEKLFENDRQRKLDELSGNLTLLKKLFRITLTEEEYTYYKTHESLFKTENYTTFFTEENVSAGAVSELDAYQRMMAPFYAYAFKRDKAFMRNIRFSETGREVAILITGGFHSRNLRALCKKGNISYISIVPEFNADVRDNPYLNLLAGKISTGIDFSSLLAIWSPFCEAQMEMPEKVVPDAVTSVFKLNFTEKEARDLLSGDMRRDLKALAQSGRLEQIYNEFLKYPKEYSFKKISYVRDIAAISALWNNGLWVCRVPSRKKRTVKVYVMYKRMPLAGVLLQQHGRKLIELQYVLVNKKIQKKSYGSRFCRQLFKLLKSKGFTKLQLIPFQSVKPFWENFGINYEKNNLDEWVTVDLGAFIKRFDDYLEKKQPKNEQDAGKEPKFKLKLTQKQARRFLLGDIWGELKGLARSGRLEQAYQEFLTYPETRRFEKSPYTDHIGSVSALWNHGLWIILDKFSNDRTIHFFVKYKKMVVMNMLLTQHTDDLVKLNYIWLHSAMQRKGYGARLCGQAFKFLRSRGLGSVKLQPARLARGFWEKLGVDCTRRQPIKPIEPEMIDLDAVTGLVTVTIDLNTFIERVNKYLKQKLPEKIEKETQPVQKNKKLNRKGFFGLMFFMVSAVEGNAQEAVKTLMQAGVSSSTVVFFVAMAVAMISLVIVGAGFFSDEYKQSNENGETDLLFWEKPLDEYDVSSYEKVILELDQKTPRMPEKAEEIAILLGRGASENSDDTDDVLRNKAIAVLLENEIGNSTPELVKNALNGQYPAPLSDSAKVLIEAFSEGADPYEIRHMGVLSNTLQVICRKRPEFEQASRYFIDIITRKRLAVHVPIQETEKVATVLLELMARIGLAGEDEIKLLFLSDGTSYLYSSLMEQGHMRVKRGFDLNLKFVLAELTAAGKNPPRYTATGTGLISPAECEAERKAVSRIFNSGEMMPQFLPYRFKVMAFPTKDRPSELKRALTSYVLSILMYHPGEKVSLFVFDDSEIDGERKNEEAINSVYQEFIEEKASENIKIEHITKAGKMKFIETRAEETGAKIDAALMPRFLFNRNFIALYMGNKPYITVDDDSTAEACTLVSHRVRAAHLAGMSVGRFGRRSADLYHLARSVRKKENLRFVTADVLSAMDRALMKTHPEGEKTIIIETGIIGDEDNIKNGVMNDYIAEIKGKRSAVYKKAHRLRHSFPGKSKPGYVSFGTATGIRAAIPMPCFSGRFELRVDDFLLSYFTEIMVKREDSIQERSRIALYHERKFSLSQIVKQIKWEHIGVRILFPYIQDNARKSEIKSEQTSSERFDSAVEVLRKTLKEIEGSQLEHPVRKGVRELMSGARSTHHKLRALRNKSRRSAQTADIDKLISEFEENFYLEQEKSDRKVYEEVVTALKDELEKGIQFLRLWKKMVVIEESVAPVEKPEIVGRITQGSTWRGRNHSMDLFIERYLEARGLKGDAVVVDLGVGYVPETTVELAESLSGKAKVIGVDTNIPAYMIILKEVNQTYNVLFNEKDEVTRVVEGRPSTTGWNFSRYAAGLEETYAKEKAMIISKKLAKQVSLGIDFKGEKYELMMEPFKKFNGGRDNLTFVKGGFELPIEGKADIVRSVNVFMYYNAEEIKDAVKRIGMKLKEGGMLIAGYNDAFLVSKKRTINGEEKMVLSEFVARADFDEMEEGKEYAQQDPHIIWSSKVLSKEFNLEYFQQPFSEKWETIALASEAFRHAAGSYSKDYAGWYAAHADAEKENCTMDTMFARKAEQYLREKGHEAYVDSLGFMHLVIEETPEEISKGTSEETPENIPNNVPVIDLYEAPETAGILAEMAEEIERNGIADNARFRRVTESEVPEIIKKGTCYRGMFEYKSEAGTAQIIRKEIRDEDIAKDFFQTKRLFACPTFFDEKDPNYVYELNLMPWGYDSLFRIRRNKDQDFMAGRITDLISSILKDFRKTGEWFDLEDLDCKANIMLKLDESGGLEDVKVVDWDLIRRVPNERARYEDLEKMVQDKRESILWDEMGRARFFGHDFSGWDFSGIKMQKTIFEACSMEGASFRKTAIDAGVFFNVNLKRSDFRKAVIIGTIVFLGTDLEGADFRGAVFKKAGSADSAIKKVFEYVRLNRTRFDAHNGKLFEQMGFDVEYKEEGADAWCEVTSFETIMKRVMNAPERKNARPKTEEYVNAATEEVTRVMTHARYPAKKYVVFIAEKDLSATGKNGSVIPKTARHLRKEYRFENVTVKTFDGTLKGLQEVYDKLHDAIDENTRGIVFMDEEDNMQFSMIKNRFLVINNAEGKIDFVREVVPAEGGYIAIPAHVALGVGLIDFRDGNRGNLNRLAALIEQLTLSKEIARIFTENPDALFSGQLWLVLPTMETVDIESMPEVRRAEDAAAMAL